jgi:hypothetical protein
MILVRYDEPSRIGFTVRNDAWDNYLKLAGTLLEEMKADGNF